MERTLSRRRWQDLIKVEISCADQNNVCFVQATYYLPFYLPQCRTTQCREFYMIENLGKQTKKINKNPCTNIFQLWLHSLLNSLRLWGTQTQILQLASQDQNINKCNLEVWQSNAVTVAVSGDLDHQEKKRWFSGAIYFRGQVSTVIKVSEKLPIQKH